jgi:RimJ/RimL family protein N-acetyltransferase
MTEENKNILIDVPMPIVTPRLILRPVQTGDGAALYEALDETWDALRQWMVWTDEGKSPEKSEIYARQKHAEFILREDITIVGIERETDRPVIWTGLHRLNWTMRKCEIGYWVRQSAMGKGYATESTNALTRYAFDVLGARRVEIDHIEGNEASRNVINKLGFAFEAARQKTHMLPGGVVADSRAYVRLDKEGLPPLDVRWGPP